MALRRNWERAMRSELAKAIEPILANVHEGDLTGQPDEDTHGWLVDLSLLAARAHRLSGTGCDEKST